MTNQNPTHRPWANANVPSTLRAQPKPPTIQWINQPRRLTPPQPNGGFFAPRKYGITIPGIECRYRDDEGTFNTQLVASLIAMKTYWVKKDNQQSPEYRVDGYEDGARKRLDFLLIYFDLDQGTYYGPAKFTCKGTVNRGVNYDYYALVSKATAQGAEPWMFRVVLQAEETMSNVGENGVEMTPLSLIAPPADELTSAYVGQDVVDFIIEKNNVIDAWIQDGYEAEVDNFDDGSTEVEVALASPITTEQYGETTFGTLVENDSDYAKRVVDYVIDNPSGFNDHTVAAAITLADLSMLSEEPDEADEIPF
jgi:hypothetical protein